MEYVNENRVVVLMPFIGFYGTEHEAWIDHAQELDTFNLLEDFPEYSENEMKEKYFETLDGRNYEGNLFTKELMLAYSKDYVEAIDKLFEENLGLEFESLSSPRFYNFENDRIFVTIEREKIIELLNKIKNDDVLKNSFDKEVEEKFTSRSGFSSFYSNKESEWGDIEDWDHNQLGVILSTIIYNNEDEINIDKGYELVSHFGQDTYENTMNVLAEIENNVHKKLKERKKKNKLKK